MASENSPPPALARVLSILGHPFVAIVLLVAFVSIRRMSSSSAWEPVAIVALTVLLPLGIFMHRRVRSGGWRTIDASRPAERPALFSVALALVLGLGVFVARSPRWSFLGRGVGAILLILVVAALLNRWIKASLHLAFAAFTAAVLLRLAPPAGIAVLAFLPALAWARVAMRRHTFSETCAGGAIGAIVGVLALAI